LNGAHQLLVYADDVTLLIQYGNTEKGLLNANREVPIQVNIEQTQCVFIPRS